MNLLGSSLQLGSPNPTCKRHSGKELDLLTVLEIEDWRHHTGDKRLWRAEVAADDK